MLVNRKLVKASRSSAFGVRRSMLGAWSSPIHETKQKTVKRIGMEQLLIAI